MHIKHYAPLLYLFFLAVFLSCEKEVIVVEEKPDDIILTDTIVEIEKLTVKDTVINKTTFFSFVTTQNQDGVDDASFSQLKTGDAQFRSGGSSLQNSVFAWTNNSAGEPSFDVRSIIRFNELDLLNDDIVLDSAFLTLFVIPPDGIPVNGPYGVNNMSIHIAQNDWEEYQVTWVTLPDFDENSFISTPVITATNDSLRQEVTPYVQEMITNNNYGFILRQLDEDGPLASVKFHSSEVEEQKNRPYLTLYYHEE